MLNIKKKKLPFKSSYIVEEYTLALESLFSWNIMIILLQKTERMKRYFQTILYFKLTFTILFADLLGLHINVLRRPFIDSLHRDPRKT